MPTNCSSSDVQDEGTPSSTDQPPSGSAVFVWQTSGDQSSLLKKRNGNLNFSEISNNYPTISVNEEQSFQQIDGFGFTLTGGSAEVINNLPSTKKTELLQELFGSGNEAINISYLRISIGASDLNATTFTYNEVTTGETDLELELFNLGPDMETVIPLLKEIISINPDIKILASPWTAPTWMKTNKAFKGGSLLPEYYEVYAQYFVKYLQEMEALGIELDAVTIQNEPEHGGNNPSMLMTSHEQATFIKSHLGPAFTTANIATKIIIWDHNCDNPQYPITILNDDEAAKYIDGSAFHLYNGNISALSTVHQSHPSKNLYFTEQYTSSQGDFNTDFNWHMKNVIIGSTRNWSKVALEWNLANNENFGPHTDGGCTTCKGAITISNSGQITRNVGYYIVAHASKFVPTGSVRIDSNIIGNLNNVAYKTAEGKIVLIVQNDGTSSEVFTIKNNGKSVTTSLDPKSAATYVWQP